MRKVLQESITVDRPLHDCFAYLRDFSTIEQWDPGVYRAEKLTPGPVQVSTRYRVALKLPGKRAQMIYTQIAIEDDSRLELSGAGDNFSALDTLEFSALGPNKTQILYRAELTLNWVPKFAEPLLSPLLTAIGRKAMAGLQTALNLPSPSPAHAPKPSTGERWLLPAMRNFGQRGYLAMPRKAHSQRLDGKLVVITGPTAGLGFATACELARLGAQLILVGRDRRRMADSQQGIIEFSGCNAADIHIEIADLSVLAETRRAADGILGRNRTIDVLINNAGILVNEREETEEGHELSLAVNLLSPVLLTRLLSPALDDNSRVINVVSGGMYLQGLALDDMQYRETPYNGSVAYARAKRALYCMTEALANTETPQFYAMHPGWAATPGVAKSLPRFDRLLKSRLRDARMGADTIVWLASTAQLDSTASGLLWFDRQPRPAHLLAKTAVSPEQQNQLQQWLNRQLEPYLLVEQSPAQELARAAEAN